MDYHLTKHMGAQRLFLSFFIRNQVLIYRREGRYKKQSKGAVFFALLPHCFVGHTSTS